MGNSHSCVGTSHGAQLLHSAASGNTQDARQILEAYPATSTYTTYVDRSSPLLVAAGRGHYRLVQAIVEAAVLAHGPTRAKRCINHTNQKGHSALMLACMNGHAQCVESLICNGASPLALDNSRHNTALHWAASCCRSECVQRLLHSNATFQMQSGEVVTIADIPCYDEDNSTLVKYVDRHNGWGLTALHLAVYKGSKSTVRALLRSGSSVAARTVPHTVSNCPVRQPVGSTALHMAAAAEDLSMVRLLLEAQVSQNVGDMRQSVDSRNKRPVDVAGTANNMFLSHLLDPNRPITSVITAAAPHTSVTLYPGGGLGILPGHIATAAVLNPSDHFALDGVLRISAAGWGSAALGLSDRSGLGLGFRGSRRAGGLRSDEPPHVVFESMLQKLRLVLSLEAMDLEAKLAAAAVTNGSSSSNDVGICSIKQDIAGSLELQGRVKQKIWKLKGQQQQQQQEVSDLSAAAGHQDAIAQGDTSDADPATAAADVAAAAAAVSVATSCTSDDSDNEAAAGTGRQQQQHGELRQQVLLKAARQQGQDQQTAAAAAAAAAVKGRLATVRDLLWIIQELLAMSPTSSSSTVANQASAAAAAATSAIAQQQQQAVVSNTSTISYTRRGRRHRSSRDRRASADASGSSSSNRRRGSSRRHSAGSSSNAWGLLGRLSSGTPVAFGSSSSSHRPPSSPASDMDIFEPPAGTSSSAAAAATVAAAALANSSSSASATAAAAPSSLAVEHVLSAFITPSTLSSLTAVTKLLINASALSGKQPGAAAAAGSSVSVDGRWAEQEHALVLLRSLLQACHSSLLASQQAVTAAASRAALRVRQQQQLAAMLGSDRRLMTTSSAARRLLLGDPGVGSRVHLSSGRISRRDRILERSSLERLDRTSTARERSRNDSRRSLDGLLGLGLSGVNSTLAAAGSSVAAAAAAADGGSSAAATAADTAAAAVEARSNGSSRRCHCRRHHGHHHDPAAAAAGDSVAAAAAAATVSAGSSLESPGVDGRSSSSTGRGSSRRQQRGDRHDRRHRSSGRRHRGVLLLVPETVGSSTVGPQPAAAAAGTGSSADLVRSASQHSQQQQQQLMQAMRDVLNRDRNSRQQQQQQAGASSSSGQFPCARMLAQQPTGVAAAAAAAVDSGSADEFFSQSAGHSDSDSLEQRQQQQQQDVDHHSREVPARSDQLHSEILADQSSQQLHSVNCEISRCRNWPQDREIQCEQGISPESAPSTSSSSSSDSDSETRSLCSSLDSSVCAICMDSKAALSVSSCTHTLCLQCAYQLCCKAKGVPLCPFCRQPIAGFDNSAV